MNKVTANSVIKNLYIQNYPVHCFSISDCANVLMENIVLNNTAGNAPNAISGGLPAAHNSDGYDISTSSNFLVTSGTVLNQDDCVAVSSGNNITIQNVSLKDPSSEDVVTNFSFKYIFVSNRADRNNRCTATEATVSPLAAWAENPTTM